MARLTDEASLVNDVARAVFYVALTVWAYEEADGAASTAFAGRLGSVALMLIVRPLSAGGRLGRSIWTFLAAALAAELNVGATLNRLGADCVSTRNGATVASPSSSLRSACSWPSLDLFIVNIAFPAISGATSPAPDSPASPGS